ncbi:MAG: Ppx/GppA phosphatase family protein [Parvibaculales bacterium]
MDKTDHMQGNSPAPENQRERSGERRPSRHKFKPHNRKPTRFAKSDNGQSHGNENQNKSEADKLYAAIDLGTNNCRLLIVAPDKDGFRVVDSFSRIVRLGEGLDATGELSETAIERALAALRVCAGKIRKLDVARVRCVATEACRNASNGRAFIERVEKETRLRFEIIGARDEAELASVSCGSLFDRKRRNVIVLDIGGGSTEITYLRLERGRFEMKETKSFPIGVVRLSERYNATQLTPEIYNQMRDDCAQEMKEFIAEQDLQDLRQVQIIGTSGTVTTLIAIQLGLKYYDRNKVDGRTVSAIAVKDVMKRLVAMTHEQLVNQACIGPERADLVLSGCAVLEAFMQFYPVPVIKVADRGLREGILLRLIRKDQRKRRFHNKKNRKRPYKNNLHRGGGNEQRG